MKRLGIFSGKVYDCDAKNIKECAIIINDTDAADPEVVKRKHETHKHKCNGCYACTMKRESASIKYSPHAEIGNMNIELAVLKEIIPAVHTACFMEANGELNIDNDDELAEFIFNNFVKWCTTDKTVSFEEYAAEKFITEWKLANDEE